MGIIVLGLFRSGRLSLDLSGVLIAALVAILVVTTNDPVLMLLRIYCQSFTHLLRLWEWQFGLLLGIVIVLSVMISDARRRQVELLRRIAMVELSLKKLIRSYQKYLLFNLF